MVTLRQLARGPGQRSRIGRTKVAKARNTPASSSGQSNDSVSVAVLGTVPEVKPTGHGVDAETDPVKVLLGVGGEVRALADVAADQAFEVLVGPLLPRVVGLGEEDVNVDRSGQLGVAGHLPALVPGERQPHGGRDSFEVLDETGQHGLGVVPFGEVPEQVQPIGALDQRHDRGGVLRSDDEVPLPVTRLDAVLDRGRPQPDQRELLQRPGFGWYVARSTATLAATPLAMELGPEPEGQPTGSMTVDALVDGLHRRGRRPLRWRRDKGWPVRSTSGCPR